MSEQYLAREMDIPTNFHLDYLDSDSENTEDFPETLSSKYNYSLQDLIGKESSGIDGVDRGSNDPLLSISEYGSDSEDHDDEREPRWRQKTRERRRSSTGDEPPQNKTPILSGNQMEHLVERLAHPDRERRDRKLQEIQENREKEIAAFKFRPKITSRSKEMFSENASFYERQREFSQRKEHRLQELRKEKVEKEKPIGHPKTRAHSSRGPKRRINDFYDWEEQRRKKLERVKQMKDTQEVDQCSFRPQLSRNTRKMMEKKKGDNGVLERFKQNEKQRSQRMLDLERKQQEMQSKLRPRITSKASLLYREEPVTERLYRIGVEKQKNLSTMQDEISSIGNPSERNMEISEISDSLAFQDEEEPEFMKELGLSFKEE